MLFIKNIRARLYTLLRWSEKYTRTDMVYLASGGFWLGLGQAVSSLSALALAIAFANLVSPETYGTYKYILSIAGMFAIFSLPGLGTAFTRAAAKGNESIIHTATRSRVAHSLIGSIVALTGSGYYFLNGNVELSLALLIIAATLPLFDTFTLYLSYFVGKKRFDLQTTYHAIGQVLSAGILVATLFFTNSLAIILLAYFLPLSAIRFFFYMRTAERIPKGAPVEDESKKETLTYGKHLTAIGILGIVASNIDKILLWKFLGPAQLAIYAFAIAIPEQIKGPLKGVGELAFPKFAAQTPEQIRANLPALYRKLALYALGLLGISILYILAAPFIFQFLFPQYMESVIYSQIFSIVIVTSMNSILLRIIESQKKTADQYQIGITTAIVQAFLFLLLIPTLGILGAIISWAGTRFLLTIYIMTRLPFILR